MATCQPRATRRHASAERRRAIRHAAAIQHAAGFEKSVGARHIDGNELCRAGFSSNGFVGQALAGCLANMGEDRSWISFLSQMSMFSCTFGLQQVSFTHEYPANVATESCWVVAEQGPNRTMLEPKPLDLAAGARAGSKARVAMEGCDQCALSIRRGCRPD